MRGVSDEALAVAVLELLAATARAGVVASRHFLLDDGFLAVFAGVACGGLCGGFVAEVLAALGVLRLLAGRFGSSFAHVFGGLHGDLSAHEGGHGGVVDFVDHVVEEGDTLELEDEQGVFLLVAGVLYGLLEFVELAEVFLPCVVDVVQEDGFLEGFHDGLALRFVCLLERSGNLIDAASVGDGHH